MARDPWAQRTPVQQRSLPGPVRTVWIALLALVIFTTLVVLGGLLLFDITAELVGTLLWTALPGIIGLVVATRIPSGGSRTMFWLVIAVAALSLLGALGTLADADPRGITQLVIPVVLLVAVTRPAARRYFSGDPADDAYRY